MWINSGVEQGLLALNSVAIARPLRHFSLAFRDRFRLFEGDLDNDFCFIQLDFSFCFIPRPLDWEYGILGENSSFFTAISAILMLF